MESKQLNWAAGIQVKRIRMLGKGNLKAVVDVQVGPFLIRGLRIVEDGIVGPWVAWPQDRFKNGEGLWRYVDIVQPNREVSEAVSKAILKVWSESCQSFLDG